LGKLNYYYKARIKPTRTYQLIIFLFTSFVANIVLGVSVKDAPD